MTVKDYLSTVQEMREYIEFQKEQLQEYRDRATSITARINTNGKVQSGSTENRIEKYGIMAAELSKKIASDELDYWNHYETVSQQIFRLHNSLYMKILNKIYFQGINLKQTAAELGIAYGTVLTNHDKALAAFEEKYAKEIAEWENNRRW